MAEIMGVDVGIAALYLTPFKSYFDFRRFDGRHLGFW
jgi:hypothetical protein